MLEPSHFTAYYRDPRQVAQCIADIEKAISQPWQIMEVCGGQTHAIIKYGLDQLLPASLQLIHGPGCPVCVTPQAFIDKAIAIASLPGVIFCSFGDMLRVPGSHGSLMQTRAQGGDVRVVYSPMDCLEIAKNNPGKEVVFFAVGFETTAPANAMAAYQAKAQGISNFSLLVSQVTVPPAIQAIADSDDCQVQGFLAAGHVCTVMGYEQYLPLVQRHGLPMVITGFEPLDILKGVLACVRQLESGVAAVDNQYPRCVTKKGNEKAQQMLREVFCCVDKEWRGMGVIPQSGLKLSATYAAWDAEQRFDALPAIEASTNDCLSGAILRGVKKPPQCPHFGKDCTPTTPLGATMVSGEGACAAYYRYRN